VCSAFAGVPDESEFCDARKEGSGECAEGVEEEGVEQVCESGGEDKGDIGHEWWHGEGCKGKHGGCIKEDSTVNAI
jgi:hypothetical protein